jgi:hypothetical protein
MKAWPFVFAASRTRDYQFVALPEIFDVKSCSALRDSLEMDEGDPKRIRTASLSSPKGGTLSCVYRSGPIRVGNEIHTDSAGRKLLFASGLVVEGQLESLDELSHAIEANSKWFERALIAFLNSSENWTPTVTKSVKLQIDRPAQIPGSVRMHASPVAILSLISILLFVLCAGLYVKNRSLESQLSESRPPTPKSTVESDRKPRLDPVPGVTPRVPLDELVKKSTIQPAPMLSLPSPVPEAEPGKKEPLTAKPAPTSSPSSSAPVAEPERKDPLIAQPAPTPSLQPPSPVPEAEPEKKEPSIVSPAPAPSLPSPVPGVKPRTNRSQPGPTRAVKPPAPRNNPTMSGPLIIPNEQQ